MPFVLDATPMTSRRKTDDGFLRAKAAITRTGVIEYTPQELGLDDQRERIRVMRTPESVFHPETVASARGAPVTIGHPSGNLVTPENYREVAVGTISGEPEDLDDGRLASDILVADEQAVQALADGDDEVSVGYEINIQKAAPDETEYDYYTSGPMRINHVALLGQGQGRAGREVRVFDSKSRGDEMNESEIKAITEAVKKAVGDARGASQTPDTDAIVRAVTDQMSPVLKRLQDAEAESLKRRQAEAADAAKAKAKEAADRLVAETIAGERTRFAVLTDALPFVPEDQHDAIRNADTTTILRAAVGDRAPKDASPDFLRGMLNGMKRNDFRTSESPRRPLADGGGGGVTSPAYQEYLKELETAHLGGDA